MANEEEMSAAAHAEHEKAILVRGMRVVVELDGELVVEDGLRLLEGNSMFPEVRRGLGRIPIEPDHLYIVWMTVAFARSSCDLSAGCSSGVTPEHGTCDPSSHPRSPG